MDDIELGRCALRALGERRFRGMTVAGTTNRRHQYTLAVDDEDPKCRCWGSADGLFWQNELAPAIQHALDPNTGWLVLDEAALGALLAVARAVDAIRLVQPWTHAWHCLMGYCEGDVTIANACEALVAAIEAAREAGR